MREEEEDVEAALPSAASLSSSPPLGCTPSLCVLHLHPSIVSSLSTSPSITHDDCATLWSSCTSFAQLCHLQRHYFASALPFTPTYHGPLHSETTALLPLLHRLTSLPLLPTFSQPSIPSRLLNPYYQRTHCPQRAALAAWAPSSLLPLLPPLPPSLHLCISSPTSDPACTHPPSTPCVLSLTLIPHTSTQPSARQRLGLPPLLPPSTRSTPHLRGQGEEREGMGVATVGGGDALMNRQVEGFRAVLNRDLQGWIEREARLLWFIDTQWDAPPALWEFLWGWVEAAATRP